MKSDALGRVMEAAALMAAAETGLLRALVRGQSNAASLAQELTLDARATGCVLDVLVASGWVTRGDRHFQVEPILAEAASWLGPDWRLPLHVAAFLKTGTPLARMDGTLEERERHYQRVVSRLAPMFEGAARELALRLTPRGGRLLDVGAGSGVWSLAVAERDPGLSVVAADLPGVLLAFVERAAELGLDRQTSTISGDIHSADLGQNFERVLLANVLHLETPERARALIDRTRAAMAPDAELVIIDAFADPDADPVRRQGLAAYQLGLAERTERGRIYRRSEVEGWCRAAGLTHFQLVEFESFPVLQALLAAA